MLGTLPVPTRSAQHRRERGQTLVQKGDRLSGAKPRAPPDFGPGVYGERVNDA
jgi:hypothetical protein